MASTTNTPENKRKKIQRKVSDEPNEHDATGKRVAHKTERKKLQNQLSYRYLYENLFIVFIFFKQSVQNFSLHKLLLFFSYNLMAV